MAGRRRADHETDAAKLAAASGRETDESVLLRFAAARSPRAAAAAEARSLSRIPEGNLQGLCSVSRILREGDTCSRSQSIDLGTVVSWCRAQRETPLFVEGAGGWMVPIGERSRMRDLASALDATVIVVARAGLGTINHAILTVEAVHRTSPLHGVILSRRVEDDPSFARENADEIAAQTGARVAILPDDQAAIEAWFAPPAS